MATAKKNTSNKETIYVDVDDEITNIIEKVKSSDAKIVALVLPKRATVMQSVVNMRLLKKAAANAKKSVVLITNEPGLLPLAGAAGVHVAKSLQSKPQVPPAPKIPGDDSDDGSAVDTTASVGALAAAADKDETETIELDNVSGVAAGANAAKKASKSKKLKHLKVPNFERFRLGVVLGIAAVILLIIGWFWAFIIAPKATIAIKTDTTVKVSSFDFTASTKQDSVDVDTGKIPATVKSAKKSDSQKAKTTGEEDQGTKAGGEVTLSVPCTEGNATVVAAGTTISNGSLSYVTQAPAALDNYSPSPCEFVDTVSVLAAENGDKFNIAAGDNFAVSGYGGVDATNADAFTGGTSKIVKIVDQKDIDDAVAKAVASIGDSASSDLQALLEADGLYAITETLYKGDPKITATPKVGDEGDEVTVKVEVDLSMLGVNRSDLEQLIQHDVQGDIDLEKQAISNFGIDNASMNINSQPSANEAFLSYRGSVTAGPEIDTEAIKNEAVGKKRGEIESFVSEIPGVDEVVVEYSPFWVYSTPKAAKKITVTVENPDQAQPDTQTNNESQQQ